MSRDDFIIWTLCATQLLVCELRVVPTTLQVVKRRLPNRTGIRQPVGVLEAPIRPDKFSKPVRS